MCFCSGCFFNTYYASSGEEFYLLDAAERAEHDAEMEARRAAKEKRAERKRK